MDFTIEKYKSLLSVLQSNGYSFQTFEEYIKKPLVKCVVLRHDVDRIPSNALNLAKIENENGIRATYYFRIVSNVWDESIIKRIISLDHEIGYHYEDFTITNGDYEEAIKHFNYHLNNFRKLYPVSTICMHGSPMSKWDNRKLWERYDYKDFGIIAEPYFDVNYSNVFYITDTGRSWNNGSVNVRDTVSSSVNIMINNTDHLIKLTDSGELPNQIIINTHPHRWFAPGIGWLRELLFQNAKNVIKKIIVKRR